MAKEVALYDEDDIGIEMSDVMMMLMVVMMMSVLPSIAASTARATQTLQAQAYVGLTDSRVLEANPSFQWINLISDPPYIPWISASFFNDGPHPVFIAINNPDDWLELNASDQRTVSMLGGDRRIEFIFYKCNLGEKATVRVDSKY